MHLQLQQFINLILLLILGKYFAYIYLPWDSIVLVMVSTFILEHAFIYLKEREINYISFSALSTTMGAMLMLVTPHIWIIVIAVSMGLVQKHFFRINDRHIFNPSNFALVIGVFLFYGNVHIVTGQLGDKAWLIGILLILGIPILYRANRWIIPICFSISYLILQYYIVVSNDPVMIMEEIYYRFYSVSFMLFVLFMLTDPLTTPSSVRHQIVFAILTALTTTVLDYISGFRVQHIFLSLFLVTIFTLYSERKENNCSKKLCIWLWIVLFLVLGVIINIEMQLPYYFEMHR